MKNKFIIAIILAVLLIVLGVSLVYYFITNSSDSCDKISDSDQRGNCYYDMAIQNKDLKICDKIISTASNPEEMEGVIQQRNACIWNIARVENDISICEKINILEDKEWCYHEIAQLNKNSAICNKITSSKAKNKCYDCLKDRCG